MKTTYGFLGKLYLMQGIFSGIFVTYGLSRMYFENSELSRGWIIFGAFVWVWGFWFWWMHPTVEIKDEGILIRRICSSAHFIYWRSLVVERRKSFFRAYGMVGFNNSYSKLTKVALNSNFSAWVVPFFSGYELFVAKIEESIAKAKAN